MSDPKPVLNSRGHRQATLARSTLKMTVIKLERRECDLITNASMPNAPLGYPWPHLKAHARSFQ